MKENKKGYMTFNDFSKEYQEAAIKACADIDKEYGLDKIDDRITSSISVAEFRKLRIESGEIESTLKDKELYEGAYTHFYSKDVKKAILQFRKELSSSAFGDGQDISFAKIDLQTCDKIFGEFEK